MWTPLFHWLDGDSPPYPRTSVNQRSAAGLSVFALYGLVAPQRKKIAKFQTNSEKERKKEKKKYGKVKKKLQNFKQIQPLLLK